jgi:predicted small secreted protein
MKVNLIRKIAVILIIVLPAFSYTGCKKQKKCGCGKDVLFSFTNQPCNVYYSESGSVIYLQTVGDPYSTYSFCNPAEMYPKIKDYQSGEELLVSGHVYWDCNYVWQSSNQSYQTSMYKVYNIQVTDAYLDMYGKK